MSESDQSPELTRTAGERKPAANPLVRGSQLGRYLVLDKIGEGGMGVVYAAYDPDLDRKVALKLLRTGGGSAARRRLLGEAQAMARLSHPNVVTVFEVGTAGDRDFVAMEFVDGPTLASWIAARRSEAERGRDQAGAYVDAALALFIEAGRGLAAAHDAGLVHRDLKPSNILIGDDGRARVGDFGLAQEVGDGGLPASAPIGVSARFGTPAYMAPEQFAGGPTDARTDQFSFCVALHEALFGRRPFAGDTVDELHRAVTGGEIEVAEAAAVPPHVRRALERGLSRAPADRFPDMPALLAALRRDARSRNRRLVFAGAASAAIVAGLAVWAVQPGATAGDRCAGADDRLAGVWDDPMRARTRSAFLATELPYAGDAFASFAGELDVYARDWVDTYTDSCRKTYVDEVQDEAAHTLRLTCLQQRLTQLRTTAEVFASADDDAVDRAASAAAELPPIADCSDLAALEMGISPPAGELMRQQVADIRAELEEARALTDALRATDAAGVADRALAAARETDYKPVIAEAAYRLGLARAATDEVAAARAALEEASLLADEAGYEQLRARALVALTSLIARTSSGEREMRTWERRARASLARLGDGGELGGDLARALAMGALARDPARALSLLGEAIAAYERITDDPRRGAERNRARLRLSETLADQALLLIEALQPEEALRAAERALAIAEDSYGPDHPATINRVETLAHSMRAAGQPERAAEQFARARRFYRTARGQEILAQAPEPWSMVAHDDGPPRTVRGRVVDAAGRPVAGAHVVVGTRVVGDTRYAAASWGGAYERWVGFRTASTGEDGGFEIADARGAKLLAAAESPTGRSWPTAVDDPDRVELVLRPIGSLRGRVVPVPGADLAGALVQLLPRPATNPPTSAIVAELRPDGSYRVDRLAAGDYDIFFGTSPERIGATSALDNVRVTIRPGETTELDLTFAGGGIELEVEVAGLLGAEIASAQVLMFEGDRSFARAGEVNTTVVAGTPVRSSFVSTDGEPARFSGLPPGRHSVCVLPLDSDYRNPESLRAIQRDINDLAVHCFPVELTERDQRERRRFEVPPMRVVPD